MFFIQFQRRNRKRSRLDILNINDRRFLKLAKFIKNNFILKKYSNYLFIKMIDNYFKIFGSYEFLKINNDEFLKFLVNNYDNHTPIEFIKKAADAKYYIYFEPYYNNISITKEEYISFNCFRSKFIEYIFKGIDIEEEET